jgi:hypothetical protein
MVNLLPIEGIAPGRKSSVFKSKAMVLIGGLTAVIVIALITLTIVLTPENLHPAFAAATRFVNAAGKGDDGTALPLLAGNLQAYVEDNCPAGSVSACLESYTPPEWGGMLAAVYRRSIPDGDAWDVLLVATYERDQGFSGVCIYHRMEETASGTWQVAAWSGFVSCDLPDSGIQELRRADAPNRAP